MEWQLNTLKFATGGGAGAAGVASTGAAGGTGKVWALAGITNFQPPVTSTTKWGTYYWGGGGGGAYTGSTLPSIGMGNGGSGGGGAAGFEGGNTANFIANYSGLVGGSGLKPGGNGGANTGGGGGGGWNPSVINGTGNGG